ncbi:CLUMA_CG016240, isoform A [Clunio marinus]|uniref:CLUMA_CG016240, isoform A n=1 Tax=Clunio marinus TaxID=568069 RepID=A0A1J1IVX8_9DIPT|nr:CLUMA_CG016240, isoform A [Clunio marinus]
MILRVFIIVVITLTTMTESKEIDITMKSHPMFECLASYARTKGIQDPTFDDVDYDSTKEECIKMRQHFISEIRKEIRSKISEAEVPLKFSNCIYDKLSGSETFVNSIIKAAALEYSGKSQEAGQLNNTVDTVLDYIKTLVLSCKTEADFGDQFDSFFVKSEEKIKKNVTDYEEEYCLKKYLIKNNLIDTILYVVQANPQNINVTGLNCEEMIKEANDDIYDQLAIAYLENSNFGNPEKVDCAIEKFLVDNEEVKRNARNGLVVLWSLLCKVRYLMMKICYLMLFGIIFLWCNEKVEADENPSFECLASYSKAKGFNEPEFDGVNYDDKKEECVKAIKAFKAKVRGDIIEKMAEVTTDKQQAKCINEKFTKEDMFVDNIIKGEALASVDDKDKSDKLRDIEKFAEDFITSAITSCLEIQGE